MFTAPRTALAAYDALTIRARDDAQAPRLVVMLPGINIAPEDIVAQGMISALMAARSDCDACVVALGATDYLEDDFTARLEAAVLAPARAGGYRAIAFLGLSLGTFGALRYIRDHEGTIGDLIMIAPFLGTPGTIAEIGRAGGLMSWTPAPPSARDNERRNLLWLKAHLGNSSARPRLALGFGSEDRFAQAMSGVADHMPAARVTVIPGTHDWDTWMPLWRAMLTKPLFSGEGA